MDPSFLRVAIFDRRLNPITTPTPRIDPAHRVRRILVQIDPARQADRIGGGEAADVGVVVAEGVVVQAGFAVQVLALETQILMHAVTQVADFLERGAPDLEGGAPHGFAVAVGEPFGQAVDVVVVVAGDQVAALAFDAGQRFVAVPDKEGFTNALPEAS